MMAFARVVLTVMLLSAAYVVMPDGEHWREIGAASIAVLAGMLRPDVVRR